MGKKVREVIADKEVKLDYKLNGTVVTITSHTGESNSNYTPEDVTNSATFDAAEFPVTLTTGSDDVTKSLVGYGLQKLLQDRTSQIKGAAAKIDGMVAEANRLKESGQWSALKEREASAPRAAKVDSYLAQAVAELKNITVVEANAALAKLSKEERAAVAGKEVVANIVARLKAEAKDAETADLSDLFV